MKRNLTIVGLTVGGIFALIGLAFTAVFIGMQFGVFNVKGSIIERNSFFTGGKSADQTLAPAPPAKPCVDESATVCNWNETPEWVVVSGGLSKDSSIIHKVAGETNVSARLIASVVVPEQIRFFTSEREIFKRYFEPLKILGSLSQFSLGVSGIKQETANQIEQYANDPASPFYPGDSYAALIAYAPGANHDTELYNRLTDAKNHYYSYLYTAIYLKEIEAQWSRAGFPVENKPEVVGTLFNIGFQASSPKADPKTAGATITTGGKPYAFGQLGANFYNSLELRTVFPL
ncbi:MAG: hypothetical protein JWL82_300 [Parcubacteria group bacterium]|nr:hypothetical protein [Parcubacteria group bacterium]